MNSLRPIRRSASRAELSGSAARGPFRLRRNFTPRGLSDWTKPRAGIPMLMQSAHCWRSWRAASQLVHATLKGTRCLRSERPPQVHLRRMSSLGILWLFPPGAHRDELISAHARGPGCCSRARRPPWFPTEFRASMRPSSWHMKRPHLPGGTEPSCRNYRAGGRHPVKSARSVPPRHTAFPRRRLHRRFIWYAGGCVPVGECDAVMWPTRTCLPSRTAVELAASV